VRALPSLVLVIGDERVRAMQRFKPGSAAASALAQISFEGGGGTDFRPLLGEALQHRPDLIVVLSDLDGPVGKAPRVPVLWAVPEDQGHVVAPFGRTLVLA
jgi:predicted metal-dependent peptidase